MTQPTAAVSEPEKKKLTGLTRADAILAIPSMQRVHENVPDAPNAECGKCGGKLRANPQLLGFVRKGVVDHAHCGGQYREIFS